MRNNRILALLLALVMVLSIAMPAFATETEENNEATEATEATQPEEVFETIYVEDADDLLELAENCRLDTWSLGKLVVLRADISLDNVDFLPIPSFGGIFDGNGHTISGLHITENVTPAGLFGQLQVTGIIKNLTVSGTMVPGGDAQFVGGIVGENYGTITDCAFTGSIVGSSNTGGIVGINTLTGKIAGCEASGTVIGSDMTGGIAGCNLGVIGSSVNKAYVNTVSLDPTIDPEDITFDFLTDYSKLTSLDTSTAAMDTGGIAGYSSSIIESCTNKASIGYPHIGYNVGGIVGRNCGYVHSCENTAEIFGRKDVGGIAGQMEPYIAKNLTESAVAKLQRQLDELDVLLDAAMEHADGAADSVVKRLQGIAGSMGSASAAAKNIQTTGTISSSVSGSGESSGEGGITVTPAEGNTGGSVNVGDGSVSVEIGGSISSGIEGSGNSSANGSVDAQTQINITTNLGGLASALGGMSGQMSMLSGEMAGASEELQADVELIRAKINEITETGFELILDDGEDDVIIDSSEINIDLITLGKVSYCSNSATINGDINVGGIAGDMGMEYTLDPEDDVTINIDGSTRRKYEVKAVIQHCENTGAVIAKRNYAGGIAGKQDLGLIAQCESYGAVSSESGNYVGGIAGIGGSVIRHSFAKCTLSGGKYIGGIVGSGVEEDRNGESSTVVACYAIVTITDYKQYAGAISGAYAGTFLENYFVSEELAGINRMSYTGCAEPITYDELITLFTKTEEVIPEESTGETTEETTEETNEETETVDESAAEETEDEEEENTQAEPVIVVPPMELPDEFKKFNLKFVVDGEVIYSEIFDYGASFGAEVFPEIPAKAGYFAYWDRTELENLKFDTTVTAIYDPYITALQSSDVRNGDRAVFFVEGDFGESDALAVSSMALTSGEFDLVDGIWDAIVTSLTEMELNTEVVEQWQILLPDDGLTEHTVRYLPPDGNEDNMDVYILEDGEWVKTETKVIGSYVTFPVAENDVQIAVVSTMQTGWVWLIVALLGLILLVLIIRLVRKFVKPKPKAIAASSEDVDSDEEAEAEEPIRVPPPVRKRKPWLTVLLVILALLVGIGGTAAFFLLPDLIADKGAYEILKAYAEKEELSMELQAEAIINEKGYPITASLDRTMLDDKRVTVISESGRILCYSDGVVFLENGDAYQIGTAFPDYSRLLEQTMALYKHVDIEENDGTYSITAEKGDARAILELLIPSAASLLSDTDSLKVDLITDDGELERIEFTGSGKLNDGEKTGYSVSAALKIMDSTRTVEIPETVSEAIRSGEYETMEALSDDLYRLANGWQDLMSADPLGAELILSADCGPLVLNESLELYRWDFGEEEIFSVQENGYALYFTDDTICDSKGNSIPTASAANIDAARLLDIAYTACMNASADSTVKGSQYIYTLSLNEEGMEAVAYAIAPEAEKLNISFASGSIQVIILDERIESVEITVSGSVQIVLSSADVSIGAKLEFSGDSVDATIPEVVKEALQK